jgi:hypothetical protein
MLASVARELHAVIAKQGIAVHEPADDLFAEDFESQQLVWFALHTRARQEKALAARGETP